MKLHPSYQAPWDLNNVLSYSPFVADLGVRGVALNADGVEFELFPKTKHQNAAQLVHGGVLATLLDMACGMPAAFVAEDQNLVTCVTLSLSINYIGAAKGQRLRAKGRVVGGGRSIAFCRAEVYDEDNTVIATADGSFKRFFPA